MKSITGFMSDISDDFKVVLVDAIKLLCLKFPVKHPMLMAFLASSLREEGGFKYKKAIVDSMLAVINTIPEAKESGLEHFCEFIEDCEFPELSIKILHVLGEKGPKTANPAKYVRFIFNREILETASVRSAAVSSLAKFGTACPQLTDNIVVLLKRCLNDNDDEVRDRAVMYVTMLTQASEADRAAGANIPGSTVVTTERKLARGLLSHKQTVSLASLDHSLTTYLASQTNLSHPFSLSKHIIPVIEDEPVKEKPKEGKGEAPASSPVAARGPAAAAANPYLEVINSIPELAALGRLFKSCAPVELTESETEYQST
jgi:coatomer protein complex subunit gamma